GAAAVGIRFRRAQNPDRLLASLDHHGSVLGQAKAREAHSESIIEIAREIHDRDADRIRRPPRGKAKDEQLGKVAERLAPEIDIIDAIEIAEHMKADEKAGLMLGRQSRELGPEAPDQGSVLGDPMSERHIISVAGSPLLTR